MISRACTHRHRHNTTHRLAAFTFSLSLVSKDPFPSFFFFSVISALLSYPALGARIFFFSVWIDLDLRTQYTVHTMYVWRKAGHIFVDLLQYERETLNDDSSSVLQDTPPAS